MEAPEVISRNVFLNRNFRLVFFGALVSELGAVLYSFAVSFYILEITGNNAFLQGLYLALCGAVMLIATPIGGVLGDRFNKARIMFICDYLKGGIIILATALMLTFRTNGAHTAILFAAGILGNAVSGIFNPASGALLPHIVEENRLQQANSYFSVKNSLLSILGVVLAGILYAALSVYTLFFAVGVCYVISGISEMFIRYKNDPPKDKLTVKTALRDMGEGFRYVKAQKALLSLMGAILFINFFFSPVASNFIPFFVKTDVALAPSYLFNGFLTPELWYSAVCLLIGLSSLVSALILSTREQEEKCGHKTAVRLCIIAALMALMTAGYYVLVDRGVSLNAFLILLCAGAALLGTIITYINVPLNTTIMRMVDKDKLSKVTSIISITSQGLVPISSVLAGAILQSLGSTPLLAFSTVGLAAAALMLLFNKEAKKI